MYFIIFECSVDGCNYIILYNALKLQDLKKDLWFTDFVY